VVKKDIPPISLTDGMALNIVNRE